MTKGNKNYKITIRVEEIGSRYNKTTWSTDSDISDKFSVKYIANEILDNVKNIESLRNE